MTTTENNNIPKFKIKLLSGQNVVLVDCPGYESELFMPQIMEERIIFRNIIPNRCCCSAAECPRPLIFKCLIDQADGSVCLPKGSTPVASTKAPARVIGGKENRMGSTKGQQPSPQLIRSQLNEQPNELREHLTPSYKVESKHFPKPNLECFSQLSTLPDPTDLKKIPTSSTKSATPTTNMQNDSGYNLPVTPNSGQTNNILSPTDNWIKCITPVHTYSRSRNLTPAVSSLSSSGAITKTSFNTPPGRKKLKRSTKPPHPNMKVEVHKRKLIIDKKKSMTAADIKQNEYQSMIKKKNKRLSSAKTRKQLEAIKLTAFDLLTTSSHSNASNKLKNQFKNALCKKASSTHPVCKNLAEAPPLRMDKQAQHLLRKYGDKKITKSVKTTKVVTAAAAAPATTTSAELATVAAASASKVASSKVMEIIGKPLTITGTSPAPIKPFVLAKAKIATLSKTVTAMTAAEQ